MKLNTSTLRGAVIGVGILFLAVALSGCVSLGINVPTKHGTATFGVTWTPNELPLPAK